MSIVRLFFCWVVFLSVSSAFAFAEDETPRYNVSEKWKVVQRAREHGDEEAIVELSRLIFRYGREERILTPEAREVLDEGRAVMYSIPNYADRIGDKIKTITEDGVKSRGMDSPLVPRHYYFQLLEQLPAPDTVRVLGELLFDERDPWANWSPSDASRPICNAWYAMETFCKMDLKNPPVAGDYPDHEKDLRTWQLWYEQVKAGTRTFSFAGDDRVYTLAGEVSPEQLAKMKGATPASQASTAAATESPAPARWPLILAGGLAAAGAWAVVRGAKLRRAGTGS